MKKIFIVLLTILMVLPLCLSVNAIDADDDYSDPAVDLPDADASLYSHEFESYDPLLNSFIVTEGVDVDDPLDAPKENNNVSTYALKDTTETTDINYELESLTKAQLDADADGSRFKNIVNVPTASSKNRTYLYDLVEDEFAGYQLKNTDEEFYLNMQGSCSDGEYVYYSFFVGDKYKPAGSEKSVTDPVGVCILAGKFNDDIFVTEEIRCSSEFVSANGLDVANDLKHGNDIAYNSLRDELIVVCCQAGYHNRIYKFPAAYFRGETDTVPQATQINLSCMITALSYNERHNKYVGAVSGDIDQFVIFDSDFNIVAKIDCSNDKDLTRQGISCDDNYIYAVYYVTNSAKVEVGDDPRTTCNVIGVFTWDGTLVREINLDIDRFYIRTSSNVEYGDIYNVYEFEGITFIDGKVLLGFNCNYGKNNGARVANFYQYDLSNEFFSIKYCPDDTNIQTHIDNDDLRTQSVLHGYTTKTYTNIFVNSGKHFKGWYLYLVGSEKWRCYNKKTGVYEWRKESEIKDGFEKYIYPEHAKVTQTASKGKQVLFCAAWEDTENKFYVSFESNGGTKETIDEHIEMIYGGSNKLPKNNYVKEIEDYQKNSTTTIDITLTFQGWNAYYVEGNKWYYKNSDGSHKAWYIEGEQPEGYVKCVYYDEATISRTAAPGKHIKMYALWNEFTIYYDSNGELIDKDYIKVPQLIVSGESTNIDKYTTDAISSYTDYSDRTLPVSFAGYHQYRTEKNLWRYVDSDGAPYWHTPLSNATLYCFTGDSVVQTAGYGEHVVFKAKWNY